MLRTVKSEAEIEKLAQERIAEIRSTVPQLDIKGTTYYVSSNGNDANDGLSEATAWRTPERVTAEMDNLKEGDAVLFRSGDVFRGVMRMHGGVTYSSYGVGKKPEIWGSPRNYAECAWFKAEQENVYYINITDCDRDVGNIIFNHGEAFGYKQHVSKMNLQMDLDYCHVYDEDRVYLYSDKGNPAERFYDIEFAYCRAIFSGSGNNTTVDNICFKYTGDHGIATGSIFYNPEEEWKPYFRGIKNFTVRNCEFGWIGGGGRRKDRTERLGNAIEIWGGCDGFIVDNCYCYQVFDAALTFQYKGVIFGDKPVVSQNVRFSNNVIEDSVYSIEYFNEEYDINNYPKLKSMDQSKSKFDIKNTVFEDNILRRAGYGFGIQRSNRNTPAHIKCWAHANLSSGGFVIRNNIFDRSEYRLVEMIADQEKYIAKFEGNTYCQHIGKPWITKMGQESLFLDINNLEKGFAEPDANVIVARR